MGIYKIVKTLIISSLVFGVFTNISFAATDEDGEVVQVLDYYPYGSVRVEEQYGNFDEKRKHTGNEYDNETDLYYRNARYYGGSAGKFISQDPVFWEVAQTEDGKTVLTNPQAQNSYSYANNNPVTLSGPSGRIAPMVAAYMAAPYVIAGAKIAGSAIGAYMAAHDVGTALGTAMSPAPDSYKSEVYSNITGEWGAVVSGGVMLSPLSGVSKSKPALSQLQVNKAAGEAFELKQLNSLSKSFPEIQTQATIRTRGGVRTRMDIITRNSSGNICLFECKSSATAPLTKNQSTAFPEIQKTGGTIVGSGKPGFPGGTDIPPTEVNILRP